MHRHTETGSMNRGWCYTWESGGVTENISSTSVNYKITRKHIWKLTVLRYHKIKAIYPYPNFGVIIWVIFHILKIILTLNRCQNITLNSYLG